MDATNLEPLPILVFSNLLMVAFLFLLGRKGLREPYTFRPWRRYLVILVSMVFCLFSFWGTDWFHYAEMYFNILYVSGFNTSLESVYTVIAAISPNYLVFRAIIWGVALYLLCLLFRHVTVSGDLLLALFCALWLIDFSYGRIVMAYTMMYLGGSVLMKPVKDKRLLSLMLGTGLLVLSLFFHKTALFGVALVVLALFPRLLNKRTFVLIMFMYPFVLLLVQLLLMQFMDTAVDTSENSSSSAAGQAYLNDDTQEIGPAYLLYLILRYIPYYMVAWIAYKVNRPTPDPSLEGGDNGNGNGDGNDNGNGNVNSFPYKGKSEGGRGGYEEEVPSEVRFFARLTVYIVLVSTIFLFDLGANTLTLYMRFLMYAFIPACVVLAWAWQHEYRMRMVKLTFLNVLCLVVFVLHILYGCGVIIVSDKDEDSAYTSIHVGRWRRGHDMRYSRRNGPAGSRCDFLFHLSA